MSRPITSQPPTSEALPPSEAPADHLDRTDAYEYSLPEGLIATTPSRRRDQSRLMVLTPSRDPRHHRFADITSFVRSGDLLVRNAVRVVPARLVGRKPTGGAVELLVLEPVGAGWTESRGPLRARALGRSSKPLRVGTIVRLGDGDGETVTVASRSADGTLEIEIRADRSLAEWLDTYGRMPLPPYIRRQREDRARPADVALDRRRYQTVYARDPGAVAAPTAGLHFSPKLLDTLARAGVESVDVTLEVGAGTFRPIDTPRLSDYHLHSERYKLTTEASDRINAARRGGRRIVAVGTTSFRVLEDQARRFGEARPGDFETRLFIRPGSTIRWVDALITNFHLPRSSLLALVAAFAGYERILTAYAEAVRERYRFYSYGDAMLIFRENP